MNSPFEDRLNQLLDRIKEGAPSEPKFSNLLDQLRLEINRMRENEAQREAVLKEYEAAYEKLTSPAQRVGTFVRDTEDGNAVVLLGDTEYIVARDPKGEDLIDLTAGDRVALNEGYAVVGRAAIPSVGSIESVAEALPEGRLRLGGGPGSSSSRLIDRAAGLAEIQIEAGDEVRLDPSGRFAIEHFVNSGARDLFLEDVPPTDWSQIGGQAEALELIRDTLELPLLHPELFARFDKKPIKGILLYGPPGCGKTMIGKAVAYNLAKEYSERLGRKVTECFISISGPKILNMWLGETERLVREIFGTARKKAKAGHLVVVFIDEAESILRTRSSGRWLNISNTVVPQFCSEMDGILGLENVVVILTSNRPDYIDPAILRPERIDRKVKVRRPDRDSAKQVLSIYLHENLPLSAELVKENDDEPTCARKALVETTLSYLWREAKETEFLQVQLKSGSQQTFHYKDLISGAIIKSIVDRAKDFAIRRAIQSSNPSEGLTEADLRDAVDAEYRENEIFPKSDVIEDWLKLLDLDPDAVVSVRPIRSGKTPTRRDTVI